MSVRFLHAAGAALTALPVVVATLGTAGCGPGHAGADARGARPQLAFAGTSFPPLPSPSAKVGAREKDSDSAFLSGIGGDVTQTPAYRYAQLDRAACEAALTQRGVPWVAVPEARGVLAPVRLAGPIRGVAYHSSIPEKDRPTSPIEIFDCRLVLALDDFASLLAQHDVVEVLHMSAYRPPPSKRWPAGKIGQRHDGALALDAGVFVRRDGTRLDVEKDFHGRIGARTCGPSTGPRPATPEAVALRQIVCEAADAHLFQVELTPDYNWQHRNHFHLEVAAKVGWFLVH